MQIKACNAYSNLDYEELPTLFLEFQGSKTDAEEQANVIGEETASWYIHIMYSEVSYCWIWVCV